MFRPSTINGSLAGGPLDPGVDAPEQASVPARHTVSGPISGKRWFIPDSRDVDPIFGRSAPVTSGAVRA